MSNLDFSKIKTYPLKKRKSKVNQDQFARFLEPGASFKSFIDSLPDILAVKSLRAVALAIVEAKKKSKPVIFGIGAHVIKCGLSPILIGLLKEGWITSFAMNGATAIHDFELAYIAQTSEDVDEALLDGSFGMAHETGSMINHALSAGVEKGLGAGESISKYLSIDSQFQYKDLSLLAQCGKLNIPVTIHIAIGTDITHQHPSCRGEIMGAASMTDFRKLCGLVSDLGEGGVFVNFGSSVILPEVFLKALSVARNIKGQVKNFTTANFDMIRHYRPSENVVRRPVQAGGKSYSLIGHHEIMLPLLAGMIVENGSP